MGEIYARLREAVQLSDCKFYHTIDFPDGEVSGGDWDLRGKVDEYLGHVDVRGKRVLDMGTASGFMSFEMAKRGANVVSADVASALQYTKVPYYDEIFWSDPDTWLQHAESGLHRMKNSYWYSREKLGADTKVFYGDLFNLPDEIGTFDVGFIGQIMVHNRDPLGLLMAVAERTTGTLVISEGMVSDDDRLFAHFMPKPSAGVRPHGWFRFSTGALREMVQLMGFEVTAVTTSSYQCNVYQAGKQSVPITTLVATRSPNTMRGHKRKAGG